MLRNRQLPADSDVNEPFWTQVLWPKSSLQLSEASADILTVWVQLSCTEILNQQKLETINVGYLKLKNLEEIGYAVIDNNTAPIILFPSHLFEYPFHHQRLNIFSLNYIQKHLVFFTSTTTIFVSYHHVLL